MPQSSRTIVTCCASCFQRAISWAVGAWARARPERAQLAARTPARRASGMRIELLFSATPRQIASSRGHHDHSRSDWAALAQRPEADALPEGVGVVDAAAADDAAHLAQGGEVLQRIAGDQDHVGALA